MLDFSVICMQQAKIPVFPPEFSEFGHTSHCRRCVTMTLIIFLRYRLMYCYERATIITGWSQNLHRFLQNVDLKKMFFCTVQMFGVITAVF